MAERAAAYERERKREEAPVYMRRLLLGRHIFQSVWAVLLPGPGCSGGWSGVEWEPVRLGRVLTRGLLSPRVAWCDDEGLRRTVPVVTSGRYFLGGGNPEVGGATAGA
jgi:hypothetical protein